jgi:hypothetical protein
MHNQLSFALSVLLFESLKLHLALSYVPCMLAMLSMPLNRI